MENSRLIDSNTSVSPLWRMVTFGGRISRRAGLLGLGTAGALAATGVGWSWLVAAGLAPIFLAVAPCAAMCALGLCMHLGSRKDE